MTTTLKWLIVVLAFVITVGLVGIYYFFYVQNMDEIETIGSISTTINNSASGSTANTNNWKAYTNTKYGFSLTLNDQWTGYKWQQMPASSGVTGTVEFFLPTTDTLVQENTALGGKYQNI